VFLFAVEHADYSVQMSMFTLTWIVPCTFTASAC